MTRVERFEFNCSLGIVPVAGYKFLVPRGAADKDKSQTGRLVLALFDEEQGLQLME